MAFARSLLGTTLGIMLCLTGSLNVQAIPVINVNRKICHTWSSAEVTTAPMITAVTINTHCVRSSSFFRSMRSAATPAIGPVIKKGRARNPLSAPSNMELPVRS